MEEWLPFEEMARTPYGMSIAPRLRLGHELDMSQVFGDRLRVTAFIALPHHHTKVFQTGLENLFYEDGQNRFFHAITVDQGLQRQSALIGRGGRNDCFAYIHRISSLECNLLQIF